MCQKEPLVKVRTGAALVTNQSMFLVAQVLRLMCLQSVINSGLKPKILEAYWCRYCECTICDF